MGITIKNNNNFNVKSKKKKKIDRLQVFLIFNELN